MATKYAGGLVIGVSASAALLRRDLARSSALIRGFSGTTNTALRGITTTAGIATVAIGALASTSLNQYRELQKSAAEINTLIRGSTDETQTFMEDKIVELSIKYGKAQKEIGDAMYYNQSLLTSKFRGDYEAISTITEEAVRLAIATNSDADTAVRVLAGTMNTYNLEAEDAKELTDQFITSIQQGGFKMGDFEGIWQRVSTYGAALNLDTEEMLAYLSAMSLQDIPLEEATVSLRQQLVQLMNTDRKASEHFKEATGGVSGLSIEEFFDEGNTLRDFFEVYNTYLEETGINVASFWTRVQAGQGTFAILGDENLEDFDYILDQITNSQGATDEAVAKMMDTLDFDVSVMKATWDGFQAELGKDLEPAARPFVTSITDVINQLRGADVARFIRPMIEGLTDIFDRVAKADIQGYFDKMDTTIDRQIMPRILRVRRVFDDWKARIRSTSNNIKTHMIVNLDELAKTVDGLKSDFIDKLNALGDSSGFTLWYNDTWTPFTEDLAKEWNMQIKIKEITSDDGSAVPDYILNAGTTTPTLSNIVVDFALSDQSTAAVTGAIMGIGGLLSGNMLLAFTGLGLLGGAAYNYVEDKPWFKSWIDEYITPFVEGSIKKATGLGTALLGVVHGDTTAIATGLTMAGFTAPSGTSNIKWVENWAETVTTVAVNIAQFVGYALLIGGMLSGNFILAAAGVGLAGIPSFVAESGDRQWIVNKIGEIAGVATTLSIVTGSLMMIGGIISGNALLAGAGGTLAALGITTIVLGNIDWATIEIGKLTDTATDLAKVAGWMMLLVGAISGNWVLAGIGAISVGVTTAFTPGDGQWWSKMLPGEDHLTFLGALAASYAAVALWKNVMVTGGLASPMLPAAIAVSAVAGFAWIHHFGGPQVVEDPVKNIIPYGPDGPTITDPSQIDTSGIPSKAELEALLGGPKDTNPANHWSAWPEGYGYGASGAIVRKPTFAMIGEAGPEAVMPLNRMPGASPLPEGGGSGTIRIGQLVISLDNISDLSTLYDLVVDAVREGVKINGPDDFHEAAQIPVPA